MIGYKPLIMDNSDMIGGKIGHKSIITDNFGMTGDKPFIMANPDIIGGKIGDRPIITYIFGMIGYKLLVMDNPGMIGGNLITSTMLITWLALGTVLLPWWLQMHPYLFYTNHKLLQWSQL